jgi:hypothetical protein
MARLVFFVIILVIILNTIKKIDFTNALYWAVANNGAIIIPELMGNEPLSGNTIYQMSHRQIANDPYLKNVQYCHKLSKIPSVIAQAMQAWSTEGEGWLTFLDKDSYEKISESKTETSNNSLFPAWSLAAGLPESKLSPANIDLFTGLVELMLPSETGFCTFRHVPIADKNHLLFMATVIIMIFSAKSRGFNLPILPNMPVKTP